MLVAMTSCAPAPENNPAQSPPPAAVSAPPATPPSATPPRVAPAKPPDKPVPAPSTPQADVAPNPEAELKIDSQLLVEIHRLQGKPSPPDKTGVKIDADKRALIDVRAVVTPELQKTVASAGGTIVSTSVRDHSILAWVPLLKIERLAGDPAVRAIVPAAQAIIR